MDTVVFSEINDQQQVQFTLNSYFHSQFCGGFFVALIYEKDDVFYRSNNGSFISSELAFTCSGYDFVSVRSWEHEFQTGCLLEDDPVSLSILVELDVFNEVMINDLKLAEIRLSKFERLAHHSYEILENDRDYRVAGIKKSNSDDKQDFLEMSILLENLVVCDLDFRFIHVFLESTFYDSNPKNDFITIPIDYKCEPCTARIKLSSVEITEFPSAIEKVQRQEPVAIPGKLLKFRYSIQSNFYTSTKSESNLIMLIIEISGVIAFQKFVDISENDYIDDFFTVPDFCGIQKTDFYLKNLENRDLVKISPERSSPMSSSIVITCDHDPYSMIRVGHSFEPVYFSLEDPSRLVIDVEVSARKNADQPDFKIYYVDTVGDKSYLDVVKSFDIGDNFETYRL